MHRTVLNVTWDCKLSGEQVAIQDGDEDGKQQEAEAKRFQGEMQESVKLYGVWLAWGRVATRTSMLSQAEGGANRKTGTYRKRKEESIGKRRED